MNWMKDTFPSGLTPKDILIDTQPGDGFRKKATEKRTNFSKSNSKALDKVLQVNLNQSY